MKKPRFVPAPKIVNRSDDELVALANEFYSMMNRRRTVRDFSERPVPREVIEHCIRAAGTAPWGRGVRKTLSPPPPPRCESYVSRLDRSRQRNAGLLVTAVHSCGLMSLTHTPSPMGFLNRILSWPSHEKPFLLLVVGHPAEDARVPDISRKPVKEISSFVYPAAD